MRVSVIVDDKTVLVDGEPRVVVAQMPANTRAVHWDGASGFFERKDRLEHFKDAALVQSFVDAWTAAAPPAPAAPVADLPVYLAELITAMQAEGIITAARATNLRNRLTKIW